MQQVLIHQNLLKKSDLASLKSGIRKLATISANLSGLSNAVEEVVKKTLYDELDIKVQADISDLV